MSLLHQIALTFLPGIGNITARSLLDYFGTAEEIFLGKKKDFALIPGLRSKSVEAITSAEVLLQAEKELLFISKYKIQPVFYTDSAYPGRLKNCYDAPILLYYKGSADLSSRRMLSIVGTRNSTSYGKALTQKLIEQLKPYNVTVISGLAHGIDATAHKACVNLGVPTIGVLGHGLDRIYPAQNRLLAEKMLEQGGLLTEFPSDTKPDRENFPMRNRIVAGLTDATVVVEASLKGGALITADLANSYNRDVFAFPGRADDQFSAGCNRLIKTNRAHLVEGIKDICYLLGWEEEEPVHREKQVSLPLDLSPEEALVVKALSEKEVIAVDELALLTNLPHSKLAVTVLNLEMQGILTSLPGKSYKMN